MNRNLLRDIPWIWAVAGILFLWLLLSVRSGNLSAGLITSAMAPASFLVLVALGQSFAMMTGPGNVDLSIPSVITFSAFITINLIGGADAMVVPGLLLGIAIGVVVGAVNSLLILWLRIPAIIATLATGYVVTTLSLLQNQGLVTNHVAPSLNTLTKGQVAGVPYVVLTALLLGAVAGVIYFRSGYGRMLLATGQNRLAAARASIPTKRVIAVAFMLSGGLAGLTGTLLAANSGGAFLDMGNAYLLLSIGAVVVGGTPIFGGSTTIVGTVLGALFLIMLGTAIRLVGIPGGGQEILQGTIIMAVLLLAGVGGWRERI